MVAVHKLLLTKTQELPCLQIMSSFQSSRRTKCPARPTRPLISPSHPPKIKLTTNKHTKNQKNIYIYLVLHRCDSTFVAPIEVGGKIIGRKDGSLVSV